MLGVGEDRLGLAGLDDLALEHHADPVGDALDDAEIVGDEQQRHAEALLQVGEQRQDLRLHRHVEGGGRLVGHQQVRLAGERHGDHHPLALAAGELVRVGAHAALGVAQANQFQKFENPRPRGLAGEAAMEPQHLADLPLDRVERVERGHRLLEHHGDVGAAHVAHLALRQAGQVPALEQDFSALARRAVEQPQDRQGGHRLAGARFADQRDGLAPADGEADRIDRRRLAFAGAEGDGQALDGQERRGFGLRHGTLIARPAP